MVSVRSGPFGNRSRSRTAIRRPRWTYAGVLAVTALAGCLILDGKLAAFATAYLVQNVAYSLRLKQIAFVDVAVIASGFLLRVLAGAAVIAVPASGWLLACTALLALFLGFGKRAHELAWAERSGRTTATPRASGISHTAAPT